MKISTYLPCAEQMQWLADWRLIKGASLTNFDEFWWIISMLVCMFHIPSMSQEAGKVCWNCHQTLLLVSIDDMKVRNLHTSVEIIHQNSLKLVNDAPLISFQSMSHCIFSANGRYVEIIIKHYYWYQLMIWKWETCILAWK